MVILTVTSKSDYQEALQPARGNIVVAWRLPGQEDGYSLDGDIMTQAEVIERASGADKLILCENWQAWNDPPPAESLHEWRHGVLVIQFGKRLDKPG